MLLKCETKSFRVKGLAFHKEHPWLLASLHSGCIQLWDYRIGTMVDKFEGHEGPVRGVCFHPSQPIFASGGDDYKLKLWNYRTRRSLLTLLGHLDYIRTVQFHGEAPWVLSASDDQTIRIWNWQSRNCIAVLAGHNHYVMCAQFHPTEDLLLTASLDQTVRVWNIAGLREKTKSGGSLQSSGAADIFGTSDTVCRFILEGHDRGVNWACFHPTLPLIASGGDDRLVKLWRYTDTKWWEVDTFRGHYNNVSCVAFHPTKDLLLSNSEDRTIRIWDINKRCLVHTYRRESDRFWVLAVKPEGNIVSVGHDTGLVVFKLEKERVPFSILPSDSRVFLVRDGWLVVQDTATDVSQHLVQISRGSSALKGGPRKIEVNPYMTSGTGDMHILVTLPGSTQTTTGETQGDTTPTDSSTTYIDLVVSTGDKLSNFQNMFKTFRTEALSAAFLNRQRVALLNSPSALSIVSMNLELVKRLDLPFPCELIFGAGSGRLLLVSDGQGEISLFDSTSRQIVGTITLPTGGVRDVVWASDQVYLGIMMKHHVLYCKATDDSFTVLASHHESLRIKQLCFDEGKVLYYSTLSHLKYFLENGDRGLVQVIRGTAVYLVKIQRNKLVAISRGVGAPLVRQTISTVEPHFKMALAARKLDEVALYIRNGRLCGNSLVSHLKSSGHPEIAMLFVDDLSTRFHLAMEYGSLDEALACAQSLNSPPVWARLAEHALLQGNFALTEQILQKTKQLPQLMNLYVISGHLEKLAKLQSIFIKMDEPLGIMQTSLYLENNAAKRKDLFKSQGQFALAAALALSNGLPTDDLPPEVVDAVRAVATRGDPLTPPPRVSIPPEKPSEETNWPTQVMPTTAATDFAQAMKETEGITHVPETAPSADKKTGWAAVDDALLTGPAAELTEGWGALDADEWGDLDMDLQANEAAAKSPKEREAQAISGLISCDESPFQKIVKSQGVRMPATLILAGEVKEALNLLQHRIGLVNPAPLLPHVQTLILGSKTYIPGAPLTAPIAMPMLAAGSAESNPVLSSPFSLDAFREKLRLAYGEFIGRKLSECDAAFTWILQAIPLVVAGSDDEEQSFREILVRAATYRLLLRIENSLESAETPQKLLLMVLCTTLDLLPAHRLVLLKRTMAELYKHNNYRTCAEICKVLIEGVFEKLNPKAQEVVDKARRILAVVEQKAVDAHPLSILSLEMGKAGICMFGLTQIPINASSARCAFCKSVAETSNNGKLCAICNIAEIGRSSLGLQLRPL